MTKQPQYVELCGEVKVIGDRAILFFDGVTEIWIPKSQIENPDELEAGVVEELRVAEWLAKKEGLI